MLSIRRLGKQVAQRLGYEVRRVAPPGSYLRPIGRQDSVLADFRARGFDPALVFDVGASDGVWTREVQLIFPSARFVTVEPRQVGEPTVRAAVGSCEGSVTLTDWGTGSTLLPRDAGGQTPYRVPVTTLDKLAQQFGIPDLVKLDVEGFELEALKGGATLFGRTELFIIEVAMYRFMDRPMFHEVVASMAERGYLVYDVPGFIRRPYDGAVGLIDLCFARSLRGSETEWHSRA